jgi:hypothetical protein
MCPTLHSTSTSLAQCATRGEREQLCPCVRMRECACACTYACMRECACVRACVRSALSSSPSFACWQRIGFGPSFVASPSPTVQSSSRRCVCTMGLRVCEGGVGGWKCDGGGGELSLSLLVPVNVVTRHALLTPYTNSNADVTTSHSVCTVQCEPRTRTHSQHPCIPHPPTCMGSRGGGVTSPLALSCRVTAFCCCCCSNCRR